ncbi:MULTISPECIES: Smr/MutS family protein [Flavobacteriaceae]|uniref:Smr domain-containing protein n=1 Tax=Polaribacter pacificus TaxID=1775173 RepID=A0A917MHD8_9FLAO|nr:Smr/MutS family protein [Polaribacter pacificus]GGH03663.1 hypothetical protein GCM10011416_23340 [Polaribacter pacificus]
MAFEIGDSVAVLDDVIKGVVTKVTATEVVLRDGSGFVFSYLAKELVKISEDQNELTKFSDINNHLLQSKINDKKPKKQVFTTTKKEVILEVDLHIHQLTKSTKGMDNYDMLNLQINTAQQKLEYAIQKKISKLVFIHGVGEGVLKTELTYLFQKYPVKFYDASYQKYGLGATEVYVFQNPKH